MIITKPMKAWNKPLVLENLAYPFYVSAKLDGIRCMLLPDLGAVTQSFKPVPNVYIRERLEQFKRYCFDGELVAIDAEGNDLTFNETQSAVMSYSGTPNFKLYVFDCFLDPDDTYRERMDRALTYFAFNRISKPGIFEWVLHHRIKNEEQFLLRHNINIEHGYEGTMIRAIDGPYKSGRSTFNQGWLLKHKPWEDAEGTITGFDELYRNNNPDERDRFGHAKRSSKKEGMIPANTLGALIVYTLDWGEIRIGTGFSAALRDEIWSDTGTWLGQIVSFKYQAKGMKEKPRFPVYKGLRYD